MSIDEDGGHSIEKDDIVQIVPDHKWGGCLAVVVDEYSWGCQAYVTIPGPDGKADEAYIRLEWKEFEPVGAKAIFVPHSEDDPEKN